MAPLQSLIASVTHRRYVSAPINVSSPCAASRRARTRRRPPTRTCEVQTLLKETKTAVCRKQQKVRSEWKANEATSSRTTCGMNAARPSQWLHLLSAPGRVKEGQLKALRRASIHPSIHLHTHFFMDPPPSYWKMLVQTMVWRLHAPGKLFNLVYGIWRNNINSQKVIQYLYFMNLSVFSYNSVNNFYITVNTTVGL